MLPSAVHDGAGARVVDALFTGLVRYDTVTGQPLLAVAESISSRDEQHWIITIEKGWTFHNGEPVTSENFVRAWRAAARDASGWPGSAAKLAGLAVVDDRTFTVTLTEPFSQFPTLLGKPAFMPLPKVAFGNFEEFAAKPIGNGPYQMAGPWRHDGNIELTRYDDYTKRRERTGEADDAAADEDEDDVEYRGGMFEAEVQDLTYKIYSDPGAAYRDLQEGKLDVMPSVPATRFEEAQEDFGSRFVFRPGTTMTYLGFPLYNDRFDDPRLRRAISMAIDREKIVEEFFAGVYTPAASLVSPALSRAQEQPCADWCDFQPERARQLFEAAGGYDGTLRLWYSAGSHDRRWMQAVATMLERHLGIDEVELRSRDSAAYTNAVSEQEMSAPWRFAWSPGYPSQHAYLASMFTTGGDANDTGYANERVDTLVRQGAHADSMDKAMDYYHHAENIVLGDMPVVPLWVHNTNAAHSSYVSGVIVSPSGHISVARVEES